MSNCFKKWQARKPNFHRKIMLLCFYAIWLVKRIEQPSAYIACKDRSVNRKILNWNFSLLGARICLEARFNLVQTFAGIKFSVFLVPICVTILCLGAAKDVKFLETSLVVYLWRRLVKRHIVFDVSEVSRRDVGWRRRHLARRQNERRNWFCDLEQKNLFQSISEEQKRW